MREGRLAKRCVSLAHLAESCIMQLHLSVTSYGLGVRTRNSLLAVDDKWVRFCSQAFTVDLGAFCSYRRIHEQSYRQTVGHDKDFSTRADGHLARQLQERIIT